jgi:hypothetical protein
VLAVYCHVYNFSNKIIEIMGCTVKGDVNVKKLGMLTIRALIEVPWNQLTQINGV